MEKLFELARLLGTLRIFQCTLEVDYDVLRNLEEQIDNYMTSSTYLSSQNTFLQINDPMKVFVQIYGVKMLIVCRNTKAETI